MCNFDGLPGKVDENTWAKPAELLSFSVAQSVKSLQGQDQDSDCQFPVRVLLLAHDPPHRDQRVQPEQEPRQSGLH